MAFIIDEQGNYIPVLGATGGGGGGTSDHSQLTNLDYANAGHTGFMSSADFLPNETKIYVNPDGSKDFTTIEDALAYLGGKWSPGTVRIEIANGTYTPSDKIAVRLGSFNITTLIINGESQNGVIIKRGFNITGTYGRYVIVRNMTIEGVTGNEGLLEVQNTFVNCYNATLKNAWSGVYAATNSFIQAQDCTCTNITGTAVFANMGGRITYSSTLSCTDVATAFGVDWGGNILLYDVTKNFTNVTTQTNQTIGQITNKGYILGGWHS